MKIQREQRSEKKTSAASLQTSKIAEKKKGGEEWTDAGDFSPRPKLYFADEHLDVSLLSLLFPIPVRISICFQLSNGRNPLIPSNSPRLSKSCNLLVQ